jgi:hypothetical protein
MSFSAPSPGERIRDVHVAEDALCVDLADGRTITVPLVWFPRLFHATAEQRNNWKVSVAGFGIHMAGHRRGPQLGRAASWGSRGGAPERCGLGR